MTARKQTKRAAVDGNVELEQSVIRARQLAAWMEQAEAELAEIKDKVGVQIDERNVDVLTIGGIDVARRTSFERSSVDGKGLKEAHPRIYSRFERKTPVSYVKIT